MHDVQLPRLVFTEGHGGKVGIQGFVNLPSRGLTSVFGERPEAPRNDIGKDVLPNKLRECPTPVNDTARDRVTATRVVVEMPIGLNRLLESSLSTNAPVKLDNKCVFLEWIDVAYISLNVIEAVIPPRNDKADLFGNRVSHITHE